MSKTSVAHSDSCESYASGFAKKLIDDACDAVLLMHSRVSSLSSSGNLDFIDMSMSKKVFCVCTYACDVCARPHISGR